MTVISSAILQKFDVTLEEDRAGVAPQGLCPNDAPHLSNQLKVDGDVRVTIEASLALQDDSVPDLFDAMLAA